MRIFSNYEGEPTREIIVLTAPHSFCLNTRVRTCDLLSRPASLAIYKQLTSLGIPTVLFLPSTPREFCDLNRYWCRGLFYRRLITNFLTTNRDYIGALFDIHSFPANTPTYNQGNVTLLYDVTRKDLLLNNILIKKFDDYHVKVKSLEGSYMNDIVLESTSYDIPSILIEFKESLLKENPFEFTRAAEAIAKVGSIYSKNL